jgi:hypothetical protein
MQTAAKPTLFVFMGGEIHGTDVRPSPTEDSAYEQEQKQTFLAQIF